MLYQRGQVSLSGQSDLWRMLVFALVKGWSVSTWDQSHGPCIPAGLVLSETSGHHDFGSFPDWYPWHIVAGGLSVSPCDTTERDTEKLAPGSSWPLPRVPRPLADSILHPLTAISCNSVRAP